MVSSVGTAAVLGSMNPEGNYDTRAMSRSRRAECAPDLSQYLKKTDVECDLEGGRIMNVGDFTVLTDGVSAKTVRDGWQQLRGEVVGKTVKRPWKVTLILTATGSRI